MRWFAFALVLVFATMTSTARGQDGEVPPEQKRQARVLANEGLALFKAARYAEAFDKFRQADRIHHAPTLMLYMARSKKELGEFVASRDLYQALLRDALREGAPPQFVAAKDDAYRELEAVQQRIPRVLIRVEGPAASRATVLLDNEPVASADLSKPVALDPGPHSVVVRADGEDEVNKSFTLAEASGVTEVSIAIGRDVPKPDPPVVIDTPEGSLAPAAVAFAIGGAGLILGGIMGGLALAKTNAIKDNCVDTECRPEDQESGDDATTFAHVSTVGFAVGGAGVVLGIILAIVRPGGGDEDAAVAISIGPTAVGIGGRF